MQKKLVEYKNTLLKKWPTIIRDCFTKSGAFVLDAFLTRGLAQLILDFSAQRRLEKVIDELKNTSEETKKELRNKVSWKYLETEEFLSFIAYAMAEATTMRNIEKTKYFKSAIINGILKTDIEKSKKTYYIYCLSNLTIESLLVLAEIDNITKREGERLAFATLCNKGKFKDAEYLMANIKMVESYNLIHLKVPTVETVFYGNYTIIYGKFGKDFINFITHYSVE